MLIIFDEIVYHSLLIVFFFQKIIDSFGQCHFLHLMFLYFCNFRSLHEIDILIPEFLIFLD